MNRNMDKRGFTLVELMLVVVIIAVLAGIVLPRLVGSKEKADRAAARAQIKTFETLLKEVIELMDVKVNKVEVCDLKNNTYYALIHITHKGKDITIDARPSDALALSLRVDAPIFVAEEVIKQSKQIDLTAEAEDKSEQGKKWQEILEKLNPEDFGKYKM